MYHFVHWDRLDVLSFRLSVFFCKILYSKYCQIERLFHCLKVNCSRTIRSMAVEDLYVLLHLACCSLLTFMYLHLPFVPKLFLVDAWTSWGQDGVLNPDAQTMKLISFLYKHMTKPCGLKQVHVRSYCVSEVEHLSLFFFLPYLLAWSA